LEFARLSGEKQTDYLKEWLKEFYGKEVSLKDTKVINLLDYGDNTMRYFRYTKYFSVVGSLDSWFIDIEPTRSKEIEMLLQEMDGTPKIFERGTLSNYLEYIGNPDLPELPWQSNEKLCVVIRNLQEQFKQLGFTTETSNRLIAASPSPLAPSSELEQWLSDLRTLIREQSLNARSQQNRWQASVLSSLQTTLLKAGGKREYRLEPADLETVEQLSCIGYLVPTEAIGG
jgi:hypothetical protein